MCFKILKLLKFEILFYYTVSRKTSIFCSFHIIIGKHYKFYFNMFKEIFTAFTNKDNLLATRQMELLHPKTKDI